MNVSKLCRAAAVAVALFSLPALAKPPAGCEAMADNAKVKAALQAVVKEGAAGNGGLGTEMWATLVNRDGLVCVVAFSGAGRGDQWPGSRQISAEKANTANAFSLPGLSLSTANLFAPTQPGGSLYGLHYTNLADANVIYAGPAEKYGTAEDPMVGKRPGGIVAFGGGLALYDDKGHLVGALGVSGDTACADHVIAWKLRKALKLDFVPKGLGATDNMILDYKAGASAGGFGHPSCSPQVEAIINKLPETQAISKPAPAPEKKP
ncbi:MAG TPA: heme-binding protein [Myxococcaceae bacterium]|nr:heme-binding protein [Myxococcaceae bacterium]